MRGIVHSQIARFSTLNLPDPASGSGAWTMPPLDPETTARVKDGGRPDTITPFEFCGSVRVLTATAPRAS